MKYCQGTKCHEYKTKDRIRGMKGQKYYATRRRSSMIYDDNFCSQTCANDWFEANGERAINHFGRITEPKKVMCDSAWYKEYDWRNGTNHYFVNDLLGQRIPITAQQYNNKELTSPNNLSQ
jgi:hypothetical protein